MSGRSTTPRSLSPDEQALADMLIRNGWSKKEAEAEAKRALDDAELEAGYDGP